MEQTTSVENPAFELIGLTELRANEEYKNINGWANNARLTVAVIDTGVDSSHPLFTGKNITGYNFVSDSDDFDDTNGHGTHVAGIIAANDVSIGIAPEAGIIGLKVVEGALNNKDRLTEALQWVLDNYIQYNIVAVNISLSDELAYTDESQVSDAAKTKIQELENVGITVVAAGGNNYYEIETQGWSAPAIYSTLAVGAVWEDGEVENYSATTNSWYEYTTGSDRLAAFSQRLVRDNTIFAPGAIIESTGNEWEISDDNHLTEKEGTSQAAPHVTGAVVLLQDAALTYLERQLTPDEIVNIITSTADSIFDGDDEDNNVTETNETYPLLNIFEAIQEVKSMSNPLNADLLGSFFSVETEPLSPGQESLIKFKVKNDGTEAVGAFNVAFYLSDNAWFDPSNNSKDLRLGKVTINNGIEANGEIEQSYQIKLPPVNDSYWKETIEKTEDGKYYIGMVVDADNQINETNEDNNINKNSGTEWVDYEAVEINQSLYPTAFDVTNKQLSPGENLQVSYNLYNASTEPIEDLPLDLIMNDGEEEKVIATETIERIDAQNETGNLIVTVPFSIWSNDLNQQLSQAIFYVKPNDVSKLNTASPQIVINTFNIFAETVNIVFSDSTPNPTPNQTSDLSGSLFDVVNEPLIAGDNFEVKFEVENLEQRDAEQFEVKFYLSNNDWITVDDYFLGRYTVENLPGNNNTGELIANLILPDINDEFWSGDGTYYIGMLVDADDDVSETDELNNDNQDIWINYDDVEITGTSGNSPTNDPYEPNNSQNNAYDLRNNKATWLSDIWGEGVIIGEEEDWYEIEITQNNQNLIVDLQFIHADGDLDLELYDAGGTQIEYSDSSDDNEQINTNVDSSGTYYLRVFDYWGDSSGNNYDLRWDTSGSGSNGNDPYEANNSQNNAYDLRNNKATWLSDILGEGIVENGEEDWYEIEITQNNQNLIVDLQFIHADGDLDLELYDANGTEIEYSGSSDDNEQINTNLTTPGTYYLRVYHYLDEGSGNNYDLWWDTGGSGSNGTNNNVELYGSWFDVFQEPLAGGNSFDVDFEIENNSGGNAEIFEVEFYLSDNDYISSDDYLLGSYTVENLGGNSNTGTLTTNLTLPGVADSFWSGDGTYYIGMLVDAWGEVTETDEFNNNNQGLFLDYDDVEITGTSGVTLPPDDSYEENDTPPNAYDLSNAQGAFLYDIAGQGVANDNDWYKFEVLGSYSEQTLNVFLSAWDNEVTLNLEIYDSNATLLDSSVISNGDYDSLFIDISPLSDTYYYAKVSPTVSGTDNEYSLSMDMF